jgi:hypothetical protein
VVFADSISRWNGVDSGVPDVPALTTPFSSFLHYNAEITYRFPLIRELFSVLCKNIFVVAVALVFKFL